MHFAYIIILTPPNFRLSNEQLKPGPFLRTIQTSTRMIWGLKLKFVFSSIIERLHSFPRYQLNKSHGCHVGVPDKRVALKLFSIGTPTWRLWRHVQTLYYDIILWLSILTCAIRSIACVTSVACTKVWSLCISTCCLSVTDVCLWTFVDVWNRTMSSLNFPKHKAWAEIKRTLLTEDVPTSL